MANKTSKQSSPKVKKGKLVKIVKSVTTSEFMLANKIGDEITFDDAFAERLIKAGLAEEVKG